MKKIARKRIMHIEKQCKIKAELETNREDNYTKIEIA